MPDACTLEYVRVRTRDAWEQCCSIRHRVFVDEQKVPLELEWDDYDVVAEHRLLLLGNRAVGTGRWRWIDIGVAKLERFALLAEHRGRGYGRRLVGAVVDEVIATGARRLELSAQAHLRAFYEGFGFYVCGEGFDEAQIPHLPMARDLGADAKA